MNKPNAIVVGSEISPSFLGLVRRAFELCRERALITHGRYSLVQPSLLMQGSSYMQEPTAWRVLRFRFRISTHLLLRQRAYRNTLFLKSLSLFCLKARRFSAVSLR